MKAKPTQRAQRSEETEQKLPPSLRAALKERFFFPLLLLEQDTRARIASLCFNPCDDIISATDSKGTLGLLDIHKASKTQYLQGHTDIVTCQEWNSTGRCAPLLLLSFTCAQH